MRHILIAACLLALTGCIPISLHAIADGEHDYFDPQYVGTWGEGEGYWELIGGDVGGSHPDPAGGNEYVMDYSSYDVYYTEAGKSSSLQGRLTTIDGVTFLDLAPRRGYYSRLGDSGPGGEFIEQMLSLPMHTWVKIAVVNGKLEMTPVSLDFINNLLERDPAALPHIDMEQDSNWPIITASTEELRAFISAHMHDEGFFAEQSGLTRLGMPASHGSKGIQSGNSNYDSQYRNQTTKQSFESKPKKKATKKKKKKRRH